MSESLVQYEFKVIVQASEESWPSDVREDVKRTLDAFARKVEVMSVEQVRDY